VSAKGDRCCFTCVMRRDYFHAAAAFVDHCLAAFNCSDFVLSFSMEIE